MVDEIDDQALRRLLEDAVADVRPADRLVEIKRRTRRRSRSPRRWLPVVAGAGVATAAVVAGVVVVGQLVDKEPPPAADAPPTRAAAVYFLGSTTGDGPRLFREFQAVPESDPLGTVRAALDRVEADGGADDPDYRTVWPADSFTSVDVTDDAIVVELDTAALARPAGVKEADARLGIQQVVYTAEAGLGQNLPVRFEHDGQPATRVLGTTLRGPATRAAQGEVLAPVNISDPAEGATIDGTEILARGTTSGGEHKVEYTLQRLTSGTTSGSVSGQVVSRPIRSGTTIVDRGLRAWEARIDLSAPDLGPGQYSLVVHVYGRGGPMSAVATDTRTFLVR